MILHDYKQLTKIEPLPSKTRLKTYSNTIIKAVGQTTLKCRAGSVVKNVHFEIVKDAPTSLLSGNASEELGLIQFNAEHLLHNVTVELSEEQVVIRLTLNLNKAIRRCHYPIATVEEISSNLAKAKVFSVVYAKDGFLQVEFDRDSSELTTFWTPHVRFRWLRMPFGLSSSPEVFQRKLDECLEGLENIQVIAKG